MMNGDMFIFFNLVAQKKITALLVSRRGRFYAEASFSPKLFRWRCQDTFFLPYYDSNRSTLGYSTTTDIPLTILLYSTFYILVLVRIHSLYVLYNTVDPGYTGRGKSAESIL